MTERTVKEWMALNQLIAIHVFGYRWFRFTHDRKESDKSITPDKVFFSLQKPGTWIERHGGQPVDNPEPGFELDIDIPYYHTNKELVSLLMAEILKRDCEQHLIVYETKNGYCAGNLRQGKGGDLGFYPSISMALVVYLVHELKLETKPVHQP